MPNRPGVTAGTVAELALEQQGQAIGWKLTARDGSIIALTSGATDATLSDAVTYVSTRGFSRSAVDVNLGLQDGSIDFMAFFDDAELPRDKVLSGFFDGAVIQVSTYFEDDPSIPLVPILLAMWGSVKSVNSQNVVVEVIDIINLFQTVRGTLYGPDCSVQLGDQGLGKCNFPLDPDERVDLATYAVGDYIKVPTTTAPLLYDSGLINGSFEADGSISGVTPTGWTVTTGSFRTLTSHGEITAAHTGTYLLSGNAGTTCNITQIMDLQVLDDFVAANLDAGNVDVVMSCSRAQPDFSGSDPGQVVLTALDAADAPVATLFDTGSETLLPDGTWTRRAFDGVLPATTRKVQFSFQATGGVGNEDASLDTVSVYLRDNAQSVTAGYAKYERRIYECTVAGDAAASQPSYDTVIGNPTVDGTATFVARQAFFADLVIESLTGTNKEFTVVDGSLAEAIYQQANFFDLGLILMSDGLNAGRSAWLKELTGHEFTIMRKTPLALAVGNSLVAFAGCDRINTTCQTKFVIAGSADFPLGNYINFQGDDLLPGEDFRFKGPGLI